MEINLNGIITKAIAGFYYVEVGESIYQCKARGHFRKQHIEPLVGDNVEITVTSGEKIDGTVEQVAQRANSFIRPPLANVSRLFIVSAFSNPAPNSFIIDKLISIAESKSVEPVLIFNKCDQGDFTEWERIYTSSGFKTFVVSCESGEGVDNIRSELKTGISVFSGNSGVGKSSLLNRLFGELDLETGEISKKLGRGRHTTRHVELFKIADGGYVADTPGFASLDLEKSERVLKDDLPFTFREFEPYIGQCKFTSCAHIGEKGCAVVKAVDEGKIERSRYDSYLKMYDEVKNIKEWELDK